MQSYTQKNIFKNEYIKKIEGDAGSDSTTINKS